MIIEAQNIYKFYGSTRACENICLSLGEGQVFGLLGPNGAGKSTLVKILLGLVQASSGAALINGYPVTSVRSRTATGYLPELFHLYDWLTGYEWLRFNARVYRIPAREESKAIERTLQVIGLKGREQERIKGYSKGMQQRLALGAAIIHRPSLVFLDEPTSALDPVGRIEIRDIIGQLKSEGTTVFLNSHLLSEVEMTCTHLGFIRRGLMIASGRLEDFMQSNHQLQLEVEGLNPALIDAYDNQGILIDYNEHQVTLRIDNREAVPGLIRQLVEQGVLIYRAQTLGVGLEEIFLDLMQD